MENVIKKGNLCNQFNVQKLLPFQRCHGHKLQQVAYHVIHPLQQSQMFDSKQDSSCCSQPEKLTNFHGQVILLINSATKLKRDVHYRYPSPTPNKEKIS